MQSARLFALLFALACPFFLTGCLIMSSNSKTTARVIIDAPSPEATGYHIAITDTRTNQTHYLPHTIAFENASPSPIVFTPSSSLSVPSNLRIGIHSFIVESEYPRPLTVQNRSTTTSTISNSSLAIPFIIGADSRTKERVEYIFLGPAPDPEQDPKVSESTNATYHLKFNEDGIKFHIHDPHRQLEH